MMSHSQVHQHRQ